MARSGDRFEMPDGSVYTVTKAAADTAGELVEMEFTLPPGAISPPAHVHADLVEEYEVSQGTLEVMVEGEWSSLAPGESTSVPRGALHTFKNSSGATVRLRNVHRPPARFEDFIEQIHRSTRAAGITRPRDPRIPIYMSMAFLDYPDTLAPARRRERVGMGALAALGRLLRFRTDG